MRILERVYKLSERACRQQGDTFFHEVEMHHESFFDHLKISVLVFLVLDYTMLPNDEKTQ
jgi:hypothetical protein